MPDRRANTPLHGQNTEDSADRPVPAAVSSRVSVLLPLPLEGAYDYLVPPESSLAPGDLVRVPLGSRQVIGVVWDGDSGLRTDHGEVPESRLKPVLARYDLPGLPAVERRFVEWVAAYTMARPGAVLRMVLSAPQALEPPKPVIAFRLNQDFDPETATLRLTAARRKVLELAGEGPARPGPELTRAAGVGLSVVKGLAAAGALESVSLPGPPAFEPPDWRRAGLKLTRSQADVAESLTAIVREEVFSVTLLDGVTGAGKTEVYFEATAAALEQGRQVLVLLPEIALSAQWLERFRRRFGVLPAEWHSDLTPTQRRLAWRAVALGEAQVVVGARSALFLPYRDLGLIVVDEEHESAFKQEEGVTYHAWDMSVVRARLGGCPIVLVSATPSLESVINVKAGRYRRLHLPERHGAAGLPEVVLVDLKVDKPPRTEGLAQSWLSEPLRQAVRQTLEAGEQALLFLNRRGYAPLTLCRACGHRLACPNCTAWLVEHRLAGRIQCHHCGFGGRLPPACPECGKSGSLAACGPGVERLLEEAEILFPAARIAVMSSDTLLGPAAAATLVSAVQDRKIDLLIGTQLVAKGHHFPALTLVGVVDGDLGLTGGDLRAAERTYQLLSQVSGRAGRAERPGRVLVQTFEPEHPVMAALASGDRDRFMEVEAEARSADHMPPFGRLLALILSSLNEALLDQTCGQMARTMPLLKGVEILGPAPAPLAILRRRHRRRFLVKTRRDIAPQGVVREWLERVDLPGTVRLQFDVDPYSFL